MKHKIKGFIIKTYKQMKESKEKPLQRGIHFSIKIIGGNANHIQSFCFVERTSHR